VSIVVLFVFAPLTWIRKIEVFRHGFIFGVAMILVTIITIAGFCIHILAERDWTAPEGHYALNSNRYWDMIGFSFFMFEGIGCVMPVMNACDEKS
jgi:amino acid permease